MVIEVKRHAGSGGEKHVMQATPRIKQRILMLARKSLLTEVGEYCGDVGLWEIECKIAGATRQQDAHAGKTALRTSPQRELCATPVVGQRRPEATGCASVSGAFRLTEVGLYVGDVGE